MFKLDGYTKVELDNRLLLILLGFFNEDTKTMGDYFDEHCPRREADAYKQLLNELDEDSTSMYFDFLSQVLGDGVSGPEDEIPTVLELLTKLRSALTVSSKRLTNL